MNRYKAFVLLVIAATALVGFDYNMNIHVPASYKFNHPTVRVQTAWVAAESTPVTPVASDASRDGLRFEILAQNTVGNVIYDSSGHPEFSVQRQGASANGPFIDGDGRYYVVSDGGFNANARGWEATSAADISTQTVDVFFVLVVNASASASVANQSGIPMIETANGSTHYLYNAAGAYRAFPSSTPILGGKHVCLWHLGADGVAHLYIDGVEIGTGGALAATAWTGKRIALDAGAGYAMRGSYYSLRGYVGRAPTASETSALASHWDH